MKKKFGETIYGKVCDSLRDSIISGRFGPGHRLKMVDLVKRFGISPMPIREALQQLQGEGLITIEPHRGARVRQVDLNFFIHLHELRTAIECMLGRKACSHMTTKALENLEKIQLEYDRAAVEANAARLVTINLKFHDLIYSYSGNTLAIDVLNTNSSLIRSLRTIFGFSPDRPQQVAIEHRRIITALREGEPAEVEKAIWDHTRNAATDLVKLMETGNLKDSSVQPPKEH